MKLINFLKLVTNNQESSKHETEWDIAFFVINTLALLTAIPLFIIKGEPQWIAVVIIEYTWALDNMRHNRT